MKKILVLLFLGLFAFSATAFAASDKTSKKDEKSKESSKDGKAKGTSKTEIRPLSQKAKDEAAK